MTDKQIIIDGVDVSGCVQFIQEEKDCCDLGGNCKGWTNCYYKQLKRSEAQCEAMFVTHTDLEKAYKAKEQECERLKHDNDYEVGALEKTIDNLKAENKNIKEAFDGLFKVQYKLADNCKKLRQCLTEIKEIAENAYCLTNATNKDMAQFAKQILQKISECEGNDVRS